MFFCRSSTWTWTWKRFMVISLAGLAGGRLRQALLALAAVFGQVGEHAIHAVEHDPVHQIAPDALLGDEAGVHQLLEVEGKAAGGNPQQLGDHARGCTVIARNDERAE